MRARIDRAAAHFWKQSFFLEVGAEQQSSAEKDKYAFWRKMHFKDQVVKGPNGMVEMTCKKTECYCPGGTAPSGTKCPMLWKHTCLSCREPDWKMSGDKCFPVCTCYKGSPMQSDECPFPGNHCAKCDSLNMTVYGNETGHYCVPDCWCKNGYGTGGNEDLCPLPYRRAYAVTK